MVFFPQLDNTAIRVSLALAASNKRIHRGWIGVEGAFFIDPSYR